MLAFSIKKERQSATVLHAARGRERWWSACRPATTIKQSRVLSLSPCSRIVLDSFSLGLMVHPYRNYFLLHSSSTVYDLSKAKVQLSVLNSLSTMPWRRVGKWRYSSIIFDLGTNEDEWSASRPCRFIPGESASGIYCTGGWVGSRAGMDAIQKKKKIFPLPGIEPRPSST
jgi:hypothetical protein